MSFIDIFLIIIYLALIIALSVLMSSVGGRFSLNKNYFFKGLSLKLLGGLAYSLIYTYYYTYGGDTVTYFKDGLNLNRLMLTDFQQYWAYAFGSLNEYALDRNLIVTGFFHHKGTGEFFMTRLTSLFTFFGMGNFYTTTLLFAFFSFIGVWHLFLVLARRYPEIERKMAFAVLFVPSVFFWGSGLMKDAVTIGFIGILLYYFDQIKRKEGRWIINSIIILVSSYVIFNIKAYILISFLPASLIWFFLEYRERIRNPMLKIVSLPLFLSLSLGGAVTSIVQLGNYNEAYAVESFFKKAKGMQTWHYMEGANTSEQFGRGSSYSLGEYDENYLGLVKVFPAAVNVTLFRPYLTEISSPMMVLSALESLLMMLATLYIFLGLGFFRMLRFLGKDSFLLMCMVFSIFFAFAVGFTSYNFGALVRYKIPAIPFYVASLFILEHLSKKIKRQKRLIRMSRR